jgi:hypothetical protein
LSIVCSFSLCEKVRMRAAADLRALPFPDGEVRKGKGES